MKIIQVFCYTDPKLMSLPLMFYVNEASKSLFGSDSTSSDESSCKCWMRELTRSYLDCFDVFERFSFSSSRYLSLWFCSSIVSLRCLFLSSVLLSESCEILSFSLSSSIADLFCFVIS